jgi:hypothetical protein
MTEREAFKLTGQKNHCRECVDWRRRTIRPIDKDHDGIPRVFNSVCVEATSETVHGTDGKHQILVFVIPDAGDSERVRFERHSRNSWKSEENVLSRRPPNTTIGEGEADGMVSDMFRDCLDWDRFSGIDKKELEPANSAICDPERTGCPNGLRFTRDELGTKEGTSFNRLLVCMIIGPSQVETIKQDY